jgi:hypothetical protein
MFDANFYDVDTDEDARDAYEALLDGLPLTGRESG